MKKTAYLVLLLTLNVIAKGQVEQKDSLLKALSLTKEDTSRVMLLLRIADSYETNNQDSAEYYLAQGKTLAESLKFDRGIYYYHQQNAIVSFTKGNYDKAMEESVSGLALARKLKDSSMVVAMLNNIAIIYSYFGSFKEQLDYTLLVKTIIEATKDSSRLSGLYHNLANCYNNLNQYRKSIECASFSIYLYEVLKKRNDYINRTYATLAQDYDGLRMNDSALLFYKKAISESERLNDKYAEGTIYGYMCNLYARLNQFGEMLNAAEKSLSLSKELQSRQMMASSLYNIAYANYFKGDNKTARKYINESLEIATHDSLRDELKNAYSVLSYIAAKDGDYPISLWAKGKSDSLQNAFLNEQVVKSSAELEKKYETQKKDNQLKLQQAEIQRKNTFNYLLLGGAGALLIISLLSYRNYSHKQKLQQQRINELETEKQLTATEAVLKGEEQERTRLAKDLHDGLGGMLSGIKYSLNTMKGNLLMSSENAQSFERSIDMLDSSIQEMRRIAHNMMPEALVKFGLATALEDFCEGITQSGAMKIIYQPVDLKGAPIDEMTAITIYRIVQELINNALKHATAKTTIVQIIKTDRQLSVTVEDDGKGFDTSLLRHSKGIGWRTIQNRIEFLKGKLDVTSQAGKGTSVHFELTI